MLGSTECVNQAIILIMFLGNIVASLTLLYLTYLNKCNLFIAICTYLSTIENPSGTSLLFEPILVY